MGILKFLSITIILWNVFSSFSLVFLPIFSGIIDEMYFLAVVSSFVHTVKYCTS